MATFPFDEGESRGSKWTVNEATKLPVEDPVAKVLATGLGVGLANHTVLIAQNGTERPIE